MPEVDKGKGQSELSLNYTFTMVISSRVVVLSLLKNIYIKSTVVIIYLLSLKACVYKKLPFNLSAWKKVK